MALASLPTETRQELYQYTARVPRLRTSRELFKGLGRRDRQHHQHTRLPINALLEAVQLGRSKYRAIICVAWMLLYWDGWKPKQKSKRVKSDKVLFTRRMMSNQYGYSEDLIRRALVDLKRIEMISVASIGFYSDHHNSGTYYNLSWMPGIGLQRINLYWGLMSCESFLSLSTTLQAVLIMLHTIHYRKHNRITITPTCLMHFNVSRKKLPAYINQLRQAGILVLVDINTYAFPWLTDEGKPDFDNWGEKLLALKIKNDVPNCTKGCP